MTRAASNNDGLTNREKSTISEFVHLFEKMDSNKESFLLALELSMRLYDTRCAMEKLASV